MSGAGDTDGEVSGDAAVWRDLIARFDLPADPTGTDRPWPAREDLGARGAAADAPEPEPPPAAGADAAAAGDGAGADPSTRPLVSPDGPGSGQAFPPGTRPWPGPSEPYSPADRTRVVRPAGDPRSYAPPEEEDERYLPAPLPPPAKMDPITKAALAGVVGGPGYLLIASVFLHWTISATAAFVAVAAFIGGFVTLVVKLGDRPRRDDDDDGAVL